MPTSLESLSFELLCHIFDLLSAQEGSDAVYRCLTLNKQTYRAALQALPQHLCFDNNGSRLLDFTVWAARNSLAAPLRFLAVEAREYATELGEACVFDVVLPVALSLMPQLVTLKLDIMPGKAKEQLLGCLKGLGQLVTLGLSNNGAAADWYHEPAPFNWADAHQILKSLPQLVSISLEHISEPWIPFDQQSLPSCRELALSCFESGEIVENILAAPFHPLRRFRLEDGPCPSTFRAALSRHASTLEVLYLHPDANEVPEDQSSTYLADLSAVQEISLGWGMCTDELLWSLPPSVRSTEIWLFGHPRSKVSLPALLAFMGKQYALRACSEYEVKPILRLPDPILTSDQSAQLQVKAFCDASPVLKSCPLGSCSSLWLRMVDLPIG
jgi:hypothetical protein